MGLLSSICYFRCTSQNLPCSLVTLKRQVYSLSLSLSPVNFLLNIARFSKCSGTLSVGLRYLPFRVNTAGVVGFCCTSQDVSLPLLTLRTLPLILRLLNTEQYLLSLSSADRKMYQSLWYNEPVSDSFSGYFCQHLRTYFVQLSRMQYLKVYRFSFIYSYISISNPTLLLVQNISFSHLMIPILTNPKKMVRLSLKKTSNSYPILVYEPKRRKRTTRGDFSRNFKIPKFENPPMSISLCSSQIPTQPGRNLAFLAIARSVYSFCMKCVYEQKRNI